MAKSGIPHCGFYECHRMPFGLRNTPVKFQLLMKSAFSDMNLFDCLTWTHLAIYEQSLTNIKMIFNVP